MGTDKLEIKQVVICLWCVTGVIMLSTIISGIAQLDRTHLTVFTISTLCNTLEVFLMLKQIDLLHNL